MVISVNMLVDFLEQWDHEIHISVPNSKRFSFAAPLPRDRTAMRDDLLYVCHLSAARRAARERPGMYYLCLRDQGNEAVEQNEALDRMMIVNDDMELDDLFTTIQNLFFEIGKWRQDLQNAIIQNKSLQEIVDLCDNVIGNSIDITDSAFTVLAQSRNIETDDVMTNTLKTYGYYTEETLALFHKHQRYDLWRNAIEPFVEDRRTFSAYTCVNRVFHYRNTYYSHVVMVCDHRPWTPGLMDIFLMLTDILQIYTERVWEHTQTLNHDYDTFFSDLLEGNLKDRAEINVRAKRIGLPVQGCFVLLRVEATGEQEFPLERIGRELAEMLPSAKSFLYQQGIIALYPAAETQEAEFPVQARVDDFLRKHHACGGISRRICTLEEIPAAYRQAVMALRYGTRMHGAELLGESRTLRTIAPFSECMLYCLVGGNPDSRELWMDSRYGRALRKLYEYDTQHNTNNLQLLYICLKLNWKTNEISAYFHMHRNNVLYRIRRIEQMLSMDLEDHKTRLGLEISYLCLEMYGFEADDGEVLIVPT